MNHVYSEVTRQTNRTNSISCLVIVCVAIPVTKQTTVSELKSTFIEATSSSLDSLQESEGLQSNPTTKTIKLFKQSEDEQGNEKWIPLEDSTNVDKAGLDQGHVVGVSFERDGELFHFYW